MEPTINIWAVMYNVRDSSYIAGAVRDIHFDEEDAVKDLAIAKLEGFDKAAIKHFQCGWSKFLLWIKAEFQDGFMELNPRWEVSE